MQNPCIIHSVIAYSLIYTYPAVNNVNSYSVHTFIAKIHLYSMFIVHLRV